eukprot:scaffold35794_cov101-Isochrysis_galbana.AAC.1
MRSGRRRGRRRGRLRARTVGRHSIGDPNIEPSAHAPLVATAAPAAGNAHPWNATGRRSSAARGTPGQVRRPCSHRQGGSGSAARPLSADARQLRPLNPARGQQSGPQCGNDVRAATSIEPAEKSWRVACDRDRFRASGRAKASSSRDILRGGVRAAAIDVAERA